MKASSTFIKAFFTILISCISIAVFAQGTPTPISGPSDPSDPNGNIQQFICSTDQVLLKGPLGASEYYWYKKDPANGQMQLVSASTSNTYTEPASGKGYYTYTLITQNASGCLSDMSTPFNVFVLPPIVPVISGAAPVCQNTVSHPNSILLTASPVASGPYAYTYSWTKDGQPTGVTTNTYLVQENTPNTYTYAVTISYSSATTGGQVTCSQTATQPITVNPVPATPTIQWN